MRVAALLLLLMAALVAGAQFYGYKNPPVPGQSRVATQNAGADVRLDQRLNEFVPLDATFRDEHGATVELGSLFDGKPVVLLPVFYKCPGICETEIMNLVGSLRGFKKHFIGRDFTVVTLGIDPKEAPELAATKKDTLVALYLSTRTSRQDRLAAERGWHFLTGDMDQIRRVTDAIGFRFTYDETNGNIVHPAGLVVLTPQGKISRYLVDMEYPQQILLDSIREAGLGNVGPKDDRPFFMACIQIDPLTGQRSMNVINVLRTLGVVTVLGLVAAAFVWNRQARARQGGAESS